MKTIKIAVGQLLFLTTICSGSPIESKELVDLGHINGKTFYYDKLLTNQAGASVACEAGGTTLASISSLAELDFLRTKYSETGFQGSFWTDGVDAGRPQQFIWKTGAIDIPVGLRWGSFYPAQTCVYYVASSASRNGLLSSYDCESSSMYALCQSLD